MEAQLGKACEPPAQTLNANLANRADKLTTPFKQNRITTRYLTRIWLQIKSQATKIKPVHENMYLKYKHLFLKAAYKNIVSCSKMIKAPT